MSDVPGAIESHSASTDAVRALHAGVDGFNRWRIDAMARLDEAIALDPGMVAAQAVKGLVLLGARSQQYRGVIDACLAAARAGAKGATAHKLAYLAAFEAAAAGDLRTAVTHFEALLEIHPTDLLAHRLVQQELFWGGEAAWMADVTERAAPAWDKTHPDHGTFLAVRAFALEEAGDRTRAETFARSALAADAGDCWGAHALAHVLIMDGRYDEGVTTLEGLTGQWQGCNQIVHHLWWHLCLFLVERGETGRALELLDAEVRNPNSPLVQAVPDAYIDLQNYASLLLRLELLDVDVGDRWMRVADVAETRIHDHASPFTSAHAAAMLAAAGRFDEAAAQIASMEAFAHADPGALGPRIRNAALPAARAAVAHRRGEHEAVLAHLLPARRHLWQMGGSHAQRDVFVMLLADSAARLGQRGWLDRLLAENEALGFAGARGRRIYQRLEAAA